MASCSGGLYAPQLRGFLFTDSVLVDYNVFPAAEKKFIHCNKLRGIIIGILNLELFL